MYDAKQHSDDLLAHVGRVQDNARQLADRLRADGRADFARLLLAKAHIHDASKWAGIEYEFMHRGPHVDKVMLGAAIAQHQKTNDHHPEFWGGLRNMPEICVAEMVCDWLARSQELATDLRVFVTTVAPERFAFDTAPTQVAWIESFIKILLPQKFANR